MTMRDAPKVYHLLCLFPSEYDKGGVVNEESLEKAQRIMFQEFFSSIVRSSKQSKGARAENKLLYALQALCFYHVCWNASSRLSASSNTVLNERWGADHTDMMEAYRT